MSLPVILRPDAEEDVRAAHDYLEQIRVGLGVKFLVRLRKTLESIELMPEMFGVVWQDVRATRLRKFRYLVYYVVLSDRVEVLAVLHSARDASVWQSRV